jgi:hypothetical protein
VPCAIAVPHGIPRRTRERHRKGVPCRTGYRAVRDTPSRTGYQGARESATARGYRTARDTVPLGITVPHGIPQRTSRQACRAVRPAGNPEYSHRVLWGTPSTHRGYCGVLRVLTRRPSLRRQRTSSPGVPCCASCPAPADAENVLSGSFDCTHGSPRPTPAYCLRSESTMSTREYQEHHATLQRKAPTHPRAAQRQAHIARAAATPAVRRYGEHPSALRPPARPPARPPPARPLRPHGPNDAPARRAFATARPRCDGLCNGRLQPRGATAGGAANAPCASSSRTAR